MMRGLTKKQQAILDHIGSVIAERGVSPTIAEMADHFGYSDTKPVEYGLVSLERKGRIHRLPHQQRSIVLGPPPVVRLNPEIHRLAQSYADEQGVTLETAANELLRDSLGAS